MKAKQKEQSEPSFLNIGDSSIQRIALATLSQMDISITIKEGLLPKANRH
jgi:hypothetical protein